MKLAYQYKLLPSYEQRCEITRWLDMLRCQYNWRLLAECFEWWEMNRCSVLPVGISQSDYDDNVKLYKEKAAVTRKLTEATDSEQQRQLQKRLNRLNGKPFRQAVAAEFCQLSSQVLPPGLKDNPEYYAQKRTLPELKAARPWDKGIYSQTLQEMVKRVDLAFARFLKGDRNGKHSGSPGSRASIATAPLSSRR